MSPWGSTLVVLVSMMHETSRNVFTEAKTPWLVVKDRDETARYFLERRPRKSG